MQERPKHRPWIWLGLSAIIPTLIVLGLQFGLPVSLTHPIAADVANSFLGTVAETLAGVLAIVLSVSIFAVDLASDKYSSRIVAFFRDAKAAIWVPAALLAVALVAAVSMGVDSVPMYRWGFLLTTWLFVCCLVLMLFYVRHVLWLIDPTNLVDQKLKDGLVALRHRPSVQPFAITELGDIAERVFVRGEERITSECLDAIAMLQSRFVETQVSSAGQEAIAQNALLLYQKHTLSEAVEQYFRIYRLAAHARSDTVTQMISVLLRETLNELGDMPGTEEMQRGVLLDQYGKFLEESVNQNDPSRPTLFAYLGDELYRTSLQLSEDTARQICASQPLNSGSYTSALVGRLAWATKMIVDADDFDTWRQLLSHFSTFPPVDQEANHLGSVWMRVRRQFMLKHPEARLDWQGWQFAVERAQVRMTDIERDALLSALAQIREHMDASDGATLAGFVSDARRTIGKLWGMTRIHDVFFNACVYAYYRKRFSYIKEVWRHTNPPDSDASACSR